MSKFQLGIIITFIVLFGVATIVFSGTARQGSSEGAGGTIILWGTPAQSAVEPYIESFARRDRPVDIEYLQVPLETFSETFIEALASDAGPDLILVPNEFLLRHRDKLSTIPPTTYPPRLFKDTYLDGASVYQTSTGLLGLPVALDPLVLYYNRDILAKNGIFNYPKTWDDIARVVPLLLKRTTQGAIKSTALALGETANILHYKDIVALLLLQSGSPLVVEDPNLKTFRATLIASSETTAPADSLRFYTSFSNPVSEFYSWNRSLPQDLEFFISGRSAFYLGRSSELFAIRDRNPNLNFDVALVPQPAGAARPLGTGSFYGVSVVKNSNNIQAAYSALFELGESAFADALSRNLSIPPAHRSLAIMRPENPYMNVFFTAAQHTFSWLDPEPVKSDAIIRDIIRGITSGRLSPEEALYEGTEAFQSLIRF